MLKDSDVVMLIGARLNWLLSHGKGKAWGEPHSKKFIQIDIEPKEMDSNVEIAAPVVGDIGSCVGALLEAMGGNWPAPPADWINAVKSKREENVAKMAPRLMNNNVPMDYHGALGVLRTIIKERPDAILVNEGANTLDLARGIIDMYKPRKRLDVGTWGIMGIGMGQAIAAAIETGKPVLAVEGDSAFGFSGMEVETICRYKLPVCVVIFNNDGIYRGTDVNAVASDPATTVFVKGARYDKMMEAFGGVGVNATSPDELKRAVNEAMDSGKPTLINAVIDPAPAARAAASATSIRKARCARNKRDRSNAGVCQDVMLHALKVSEKADDNGHAVKPRRRNARQDQGGERSRRRCAPKKVVKLTTKRARRRRRRRPNRRRQVRAAPTACRSLRPSPGARPARRSTASRCSTSPTCSRVRPARSCSATWAPTASRSSVPASATSRAASCAT